MKQQIRRDPLGRILGKVGNAFFFNEDESWKDEKVSPDKMMFPSHSGNMNSEIRTYHISELQK